jgi:hypothetical protein
MLNWVEKGSYRIEEIAEYYSVSKRSVYLWIKGGHLETIETAHGTRIPLESIKKMKTACRYEPKPQPEKTLMSALNLRIAISIRYSIKRDKRTEFNWEELVGFTLDDLKRHIEMKFTDGMTWDEFMKGKIHIDHIIPRAKLRFTSYDQDNFKKCWSLQNLQPLWAKENIRKGARMDHPTQKGVIL